MHAADNVLWRYADQKGIVPVGGLHEIPTHIRADLARWLRQKAEPCPHSVALALSGIVFRVAGRLEAWCATCATESHIDTMTTTCARCARAVSIGGHTIAFSLVGGVLVLGAWCAGCWEGETE